MAERAVFFKGCWLWEAFQYWTPWGVRQDDTQHLGVRDLYEVNNPRSPNFGADIEVHTFVDVTTTHSDLTDASTFELLMMQLQKELQGLATTLGPLSWADDPDRNADVQAGPYPEGTQVISHAAAGGGWTPAVGRYVLARSPTDGQGFTAVIEAVGAGTVTITVPAGFIVDNTWSLVDVQVVIPDCAYVSMDPGNALDAGMREDWRPDIAFQFRGPGAATWSADHEVPRGNS